MKHKIILKESSSPTLLIINTNKKYRGDIKELINAELIEIVRLDDSGLCLLVDEDGYGKDLPHNFFLSFGNSVYPIQTIIGDVVFARLKPLDYSNGEPWDYELESLTESDIQTIKQILRDDVQAKYRSMFENLYGDTNNPQNYWGFTVTSISDI